MSLNHWQSPHKKSMVRLYVDGSVFHDLPELSAQDVKIWIEPSETLMAGWVVKAKGDVSALGKGLAFQQRVMEAVGIDHSTSWSELVKMANSKTRARAKKSVAQFGSCHKRRENLVQDPVSGRANEAAALDVSSIKMLGPVTIQMDHREPELLTTLLADHPMITVETVSLDLGDIAIEDHEGNRLIIERKRCDDSTSKTDFEVSIQNDGRLFDQSERLKMEAGASDKQIIPVFLLEGDVYGNSSTMLCQQIDGAISFLSVVQKVSVLPTYNLNHSAYMIAKLASHFVDGLYTPVSLHKAKPKAIFEQQKYVLEALPGVSCKVAELLLETFGSVRNVMAASKADLLKVNGLGPKKVEALLKVLGD